MKREWGRGEVCTWSWWGEVREMDHLKVLDVDGRIILKCIFKKWDGEKWTRLLWLWMGQETGCCEWGNEPSGSIKCGKFPM